MSLELAAQHLASRGRGPDTQLIHMAPQEVAGLHALAKAHGGSLTTNPDTGLPEAGFLSSILPMVIGGALAATGVGAPLAAAMVGGGYGLATGSLSKGLMAGLGAFGGAGLAGGLMGAGAAGAAELGAGAAGSLSPTAATAASELAGTQAALQQNALAGIGVPSSAAAGTGAMSFAPGTAPNLLGQTSALSGPMSVPVSTGQLASGVSQVATATPMATAPLSYADKLSQMGRGFTNLGTEAGREAFMSKEGVGGLGGLAKYGMAAAAPIMFQEPKAAAKPPEEKPYEYSYSSGYNPTPDEGYTGAETGERMHFDHRFTRKAAGGGIMDIGPVEAMSQQNQSQMRPAYAQGGVSDMAVNPYTGSESFAGGGQINLQGTIDMGGAGGGGNQYGGGFGGSFGSGGSQAAAPSVMPRSNPYGGSPLQAPSNGFDPQAVAANPQGFGQYMAQMEQREQQMPGSTMISRPQGGSLQQLAAQMSPEQRDADRRQMEMLTGYGPTGFNHGGGPSANPRANMFAEGGDTTEKPAKDPYNTMTGQSAAMYDYLMGQGPRPAAAPRAPAPVMAAPQGAGLADAGKSVAPLPGGTAFLGQPPAGAAPSGLSPITTPEASSPFGGQLGGGQSGEPLTMSYTFDPVTGGFRKLAPTEDNYATKYEAPATNTQLDYGGGGAANGGLLALAQGGPSHLGDYSDGGRLLRGPGDGVSDSIPASIGDKRPARLADGEFVVPARIVSELGNGSTEAGARKLYAMMDRVQKARAKTTGKNRVAADTKAARLLPV